MAHLKIENIRKELAECGWDILSEYKNLDTEVRLLCPKKHEVFTTFKKWRKKKECPICAEASEKYIEVKIVPKGSGKKRILALDQATKNTGWSVYDDTTLIKCGLYEASGSGEIERISDIKKWLLCIIDSWNPDYIFIEDIQLQNKIAGSSDSFNGVTTFKVLAHLQGVLSNVIYEKGIKMYPVISSVWRKECSIKGKTRTDKKRGAQLRVKDLYQIDVPNDVAEAVCIGYYGAKVIEKETSMIKW